MNTFAGEEKQCYENLKKSIDELIKAINENAKLSNNLQWWIIILTGVMALGIIAGLFL